jgi:hypothetical protein
MRPPTALVVNSLVKSKTAPLSGGLDAYSLELIKMQTSTVRKAERLHTMQCSPRKSPEALANEVQDMKKRVKIIEQLLIQSEYSHGVEQQLTRELLLNERTRLLKLLDDYKPPAPQEQYPQSPGGGRTERRYNSLKMPQGPELDEYAGTISELGDYPTHSQQQIARIHSTSRTIEPKPSWTAHREGSFFSRGDVSEISRRNSDSFDDSELDIGFCSDSDDMEESVISNPLPTITPKVHEFKKPSFIIHEPAGNDTTRAKDHNYAKTRKDKPVAAPANPLIVQVAPYPYYPPPYSPMQYPYPPYSPMQYPYYYPQPNYPVHPPQDPPREVPKTPVVHKVDSCTQCSPPALDAKTSMLSESLYLQPPYSEQISLADKSQAVEVQRQTNSFEVQETPKPTRRVLTISKEVSQVEIKVEMTRALEDLAVVEVGLADSEGSSDDLEQSVPAKQGFENISLQTSVEYPPPPKAELEVVDTAPIAELQRVEELPKGRPKAWAMEISEEGKTLEDEALSAKKLQIMKKLQERKLPSAATRQKSPKSKAELFELRKEMLKAQKKPKDPREEASEEPIRPQTVLSQRLASGVKVKISKQEMKRLSEKFTSLDPQKAERDEQERKRTELRQRVSTAKAYEEKSRENRLKRLRKAEAQ